MFIWGKIFRWRSTTAYIDLHIQPDMYGPPALSHHVDTGETLLECDRRLRLGTTKKSPGWSFSPPGPLERHGQEAGKGEGGRGSWTSLPEASRLAQIAQSEKVCLFNSCYGGIKWRGSWRVGCMFRIFLQASNLVPGQRWSHSSLLAKITGRAVQIRIERVQRRCCCSVLEPLTWHGLTTTRTSGKTKPNPDVLLSQYFERSKPFQETIILPFGQTSLLSTSSPDEKSWGSQPKKTTKTLKGASRVGTSPVLVRPDGNIDARPRPCELLRHLDQRPPDLLSN